MSIGRDDFINALNLIESDKLSREEILDVIAKGSFDQLEAEQLYLAAVTRSPYVLFSIPWPLRSPEICLTAIKNGKGSSELIRSIPTNLKNYDEILLAMVSQDGKSLELVPEPKRTFEMCVAGVTNSIFALPYVPENMLDQNEFQESLKQALEGAKHGYLKLVPKSKRDLAICTLAVEASWKAIIDVPESLLHHDEFKIAIAKCHQEIKNDWHFLTSCPETILTKDDYVTAVNQDYHALELVPEKCLNNPDFKNAFKLYHENIESNWSLLDSVPEKLLSKELCLTAVKSKIDNFHSIPKTFRDYDVCLTAGTSAFGSTMILNVISNYEKNSSLSKKEYIALCVMMFNVNTMYSPDLISQRYKDFVFLSSIAKECSYKVLDGLFDKDYKKNTLLTQDEYKNVLLLAIEKDAAAEEIIPKEMLDYDICLALVKKDIKFLSAFSNWKNNTQLTEDEYHGICLAALEQDVLAIQYLPKHLLNYDTCLKAVSHYGMALRSISDFSKYTTLSENEFIQVMLAAVSNNPMALQFVDEKYKTLIIDTLTPEKIIFRNFSAINFFPKNHAYQPTIDKCLMEIEHVVVEDSAQTEREVVDSFNVYSNSPKRLEKTLLCNARDLENLLSEIEKMQSGNPKQLNLVLLGHASLKIDTLAGIEPNKLCTILKSHINVNKVTLLGCNTAQAKQFDEEKLMAQRYRANLKSPSGIILLSSMPDLGNQKFLDDCLQKMSFDKKNLKAEEVNILVNDTPCKLIHLKKILGQIQTKAYPIDQKNMGAITKILTGKPNGKIPFPPKKNNLPLYYRGGKGTEFLTKTEVESLYTIVENPRPDLERFTKQHPLYKGDKKNYAFLSGIEIDFDPNEDKILSSFQRKVLDAIQDDPDLKRSVIVKGYTNVVHVDLAEKQFRKANDFSYTSVYKDAARPHTIFKEKENVNKKKINKYYSDFFKDMAENTKTSDISDFKSIKAKTKIKK